MRKFIDAKQKNEIASALATLPEAFGCLCCLLRNAADARRSRAATF
jgi:hypothetical protein